MAKINIDTMKTVGYILKNRLKGYKLLKNPKGTNPTSVTMMKGFHGTTRDYHDELFINTRINRQKIDGKFVEDKKEIIATYLINPKTKTPSGKKNLSVYIKKDGQTIYREKEALSEAEFAKRSKPKWKNEREEWSYVESLKEKNKSFYFPHVSWFDKIISLGLWKRMFGYDGRPIEKGFWQTLASNLNNSYK